MTYLRDSKIGHRQNELQNKCAFYYPRSKLSCNKSRLLQVTFAKILNSDWKKFRGSHAIHGRYVICGKTSLPWAGKTRSMCEFFGKK